MIYFYKTFVKEHKTRHIITDNPNYNFDEKQYEEKMRANAEAQRKMELIQKQANINRYIDQILGMIDKKTYKKTVYGTIFKKYKYRFQLEKPFVRWYMPEIQEKARQTSSELIAVADILKKRFHLGIY